MTIFQIILLVLAFLYQAPAIQFKALQLPVNQSPEEIRIMVPETFHFGEVEITSDTVAWYGIYNEPERFCIRKTPVEFERVFDPVIDTEGEKTGIRVIAGNPSQLLFLVNHHFGKMSGASISTSLSAPFRINAGDTLDVSPEAAQPALLVARDDGLYLMSSGREQKLTDVYPGNMEEYTQVIWAGDLDGDYRVDVLTNEIFHYNTWINYQLFLSSFASADDLVGQAAWLTAQGC